MIDDINAAGIGIQASVNSAGNGIELNDTTGSTASNLVVADGDSNQTAEKLGLATNAATTSVNSGNLNLETVSENTTLASLNGGQGVAQGFFTITASNGAQGRVNLGSNQTTIGDVLTEINTLGIGVQAQINSAGNGILLYDTAGGSGTLQVTEGQSTTAADLHLLGSESTTVVNGHSTQAINGSTVSTITLSPGDTLQDLANEINAANVGATATVFSDGSLLNPYHLAISSNVTGLAGQLQIDTSAARADIEPDGGAAKRPAVGQQHTRFQLEQHLQRDPARGHVDRELGVVDARHNQRRVRFDESRRHADRAGQQLQQGAERLVAIHRL